MTTSLNPKEIEHFAQDSARWWEEDGPFRPLHRLGPLRMGYIRAQVEAHFGLDTAALRPFKGLRMLDIGCGGGLVCEPLTRLGAAVTGVDADEQAIEVARAHAVGAGLNINYVAGLAENLKALSPTGRGLGEGDKKARSSKNKINDGFAGLSVPLTQPSPRRGEGFKEWDVVLALEIVEHVADRDYFVRTCAELCRPGGLVMFSTLNRTAKSYALGIVVAEHILRWVPRGTHDWRKFVRPSELAASARQAGLREGNLTGHAFNPRTKQFETAHDVAVNYFFTMEKPA